MLLVFGEVYFVFGKVYVIFGIMCLDSVFRLQYTTKVCVAGILGSVFCIRDCAFGI